MIGARSTCVSVRRVIRICVAACPQPRRARGDRAKKEMQVACFAPPDNTNGARWLDHLRARATSVDADSMPELGHGLCKPWHWPWSGRRPWTEWPSAFGHRPSCAFFAFVHLHFLRSARPAGRDSERERGGTGTGTGPDVTPEPSP